MDTRHLFESTGKPGHLKLHSIHVWMNGNTAFIVETVLNELCDSFSRKAHFIDLSEDTIPNFSSVHHQFEKEMLNIQPTPFMRNCIMFLHSVACNRDLFCASLLIPVRVCLAGV